MWGRTDTHEGHRSSASSLKTTRTVTATKIGTNRIILESGSSALSQHSNSKRRRGGPASAAAYSTVVRMETPLPNYFLKGPQSGVGATSRSDIKFWGHCRFGANCRGGFLCCHALGGVTSLQVLAAMRSHFDEQQFASMFITIWPTWNGSSFGFELSELRNRKLALMK